MNATRFGPPIVFCTRLVVPGFCRPYPHAAAPRYTGQTAPDRVSDTFTLHTLPSSRMVRPTRNDAVYPTKLRSTYRYAVIQSLANAIPTVVR